jgi:hypothetical protein
MLYRLARAVVRRLMGQEATTEGMARVLIAQAGGHMWKWVSPGQRGVPDNLVVWPGGIVHFIEFKSPKARPDKQQELQHLKLMKLGAKVWLLDNLELVKDYVKAHAPKGRWGKDHP